MYCNVYNLNKSSAWPFISPCMSWFSLCRFFCHPAMKKEVRKQYWSISVMEWISMRDATPQFWKVSPNKHWVLSQRFVKHLCLCQQMSVSFRFPILDSFCVTLQCKRPQLWRQPVHSLFWDTIAAFFTLRFITIVICTIFYTHFLQSYLCLLMSLSLPPFPSKLDHNMLRAESFSMLTFHVRVCVH